MPVFTKSHLTAVHRTTFAFLYRPAALVAVLAGFALRLQQLGAESFWYDETVSVYLARQPVGAMIAHTARDIHPPGYYLLLHLWQTIASPSLEYGLEFLYGWPSLWAGIVAMGLIYAIGSRLFSPAVALGALWLAAFHPFQLWYSQEVRMYTVGAALALLCFWAVLQFQENRSPARWLAVYVGGAAAGLYTLYYFAFWLAALNIWVFWSIWRNGPGRALRVGSWLAAQGGVLLLFVPWLPVALHQMLEPPVPPWRTSWTTPDAFLASLSEAATALWLGQSPPGPASWLWALGVAFGVFVALRQPQTYPAIRQVLAIVFLPIALLFVLTLLGTPVYHVRYVFLYSPLFLLIPSALFQQFWKRSRLIAGCGLLIWGGATLLAVQNYWSSAPHRTDDHRAAVAALAARWQPGDIILVNAGWIYPVLEIYWPARPVGFDGSSLEEVFFSFPLFDYAKKLTLTASRPAAARLGSVDGAQTLGWGDPASDFFALSAVNTQKLLTTVAENSTRIWHYRLYDTVSDPQGLVRQWLSSHLLLLDEQPIPGRDFGLVQLYATPKLTSPSLPAQPDISCFAQKICLYGYAKNTSAEAGRPLHWPAHWHARTSLPNLTTSLRLYDRQGRLAAQHDAPFLPASDTWQAGQSLLQSLVLPLPASLKPDDYTLQLLVYSPDTGDPLPPSAAAADNQRLLLGSVTVLPPKAPPARLPPAKLAFDYLDLLDAQISPSQLQPGGWVHAALFWRPHAHPYRESYQVLLQLRDSSHTPQVEWIFPLGGYEYPSGSWLPEIPVRDLYDFQLPADLPPGHYQLLIGLRRSSDGLSIPADWPASTPAALTDLQVVP